LTGVISPFERKRNKSLASSDVPQILAVAFTYQLPFGTGKRFLSKNSLVDKVVSGWELTSIIRDSSGQPMFFRSGNCNIPGQFAMGCIPALLPGANPYAQDKSHFDVNKPLFSAAAFNPPASSASTAGRGRASRTSAALDITTKTWG